MKKIIFIILITSGMNSLAQNVTIPDTNFKNYLVTNTSVNTSGDNEIQVSEAVAFTGTLDLQFWGVNDLTGIEAFVNLTVLDCGDNNLTSIDLSQNTALTQLYCYDNQLTNLDLTHNTLLTALDCRDNFLTSLDMSNNLDLTYLQCTFNQLVNLNVSQNTLLQTLRCYSNNITSLNLNNCFNLVTLRCYNNDLTVLDLSLNSSLTILQCSSNMLTTLYVENGNNLNVTTFSAVNNPDLNCIQVDDEVYSDTNWTAIDAQTSFSENCALLSVDEFNAIDFELSPNPASSLIKINTEVNLDYTIFDLQGKTIKNGRLLAGSNQLDISHLSAGLYVFKANNSNSKVIYRKFYAY